MDAIYEMIEWTRVDDLLVNRVSIANQILGARYDGDLSNPVRITDFRGGRRVTLCGERFCEYLMYDLQSIRDAFARVDAKTHVNYPQNSQLLHTNRVIKL